MNKILIGLIIGAGAVIALSGKANSKFQEVLDGFSYSFDRIRLLGVDEGTTMLGIMWSATNSNLFSISIQGFEGYLHYNNERFAEVNTDSVIELPSGETKAYQIKLNIEDEKAKDWLKSLWQSQSIKNLFSIKGHIKVSGFKIPVSRTINGLDFL